jgi:hypothetical protein
MNYRIRRVSLKSLLMHSLLLGWLVTLPAAAVLAWLVIQALQAVHQALEQVAPITITLLGQEIARIDLLAYLRLRETADLVSQWVAASTLTFFTLTLALTVGGLLILIVSTLLIGLSYNALARAGGGLVLEVVKTLGNEQDKLSE